MCGHRRERRTRTTNRSTEEGEGGDGHPCSCAGLICVDLVAAVRRGDHGAMAALSKQCERYVKRWFRTGLTNDDCDEIVLDALCDAFGDPVCSTEETAEGLVRALEKHKKRKQREKQRLRAQNRAIVELDEDTTPPAIPSHEEDAITDEHFSQSLIEVFEAMEAELPLQTARDHDLIIRHYGLEASFPAKAPPFTFLTPAAARKAVYRARERFRAALEERLGTRLEKAAAAGREPVALALKIVQGERFIEAVDVLGELKRSA